jgi:transcriptional regulator with XRE-family HTH domain
MEFKKNMRLKVALAANDLSQKQLADKTGINRSLINLHINGRYRLNTDQQQRVAKALNRSVDELFRG